jgi:Domain of Unknown Function (DUF1080)
MEQELATEDKKPFFKNDRLPVCSMLAFYSICILGLVSAAFWGLNRRMATLSANSTSTALAIATQQANATATVIAHSTEQAQYEFIDTFDDNSAHWLKELVTDEYMTGTINISGGVYMWNIREVKQPFLYWAKFHRGSWVKDFDIYVDSKVTKGELGDACTGFVFRAPSSDWEKGAYIFFVCNNSYYEVYYYEQGKWETIQEKTYSDAIQNTDWNRLEVRAREDHFAFLINNDIVFEMTDDRQKMGGIGLLIEVNETKPVTILFDNFGYQRR